MFDWSMLSVVFTVVFAATGLYALARLARLLAGEVAVGDRLVELFHLAMSLAMIAMAWAYTGGPETPGGRTEVVVFGAFTVWFAYRATVRDAAHSPLANGYHVAMGAAMTWMVAAMPLIMGSSHAGSSGGGHHGGSAPVESAEPVAPPAPAPGWVVVVTIAFVVLSVAAAAWWAARAVRAGDQGGHADAGGTVLTRTTVTRSARLEAGCHVLMSLGMGGMLVAML
jgi:hypothetical protein